MNNLIMLLTLTVLFASCASTHPGQMAESRNRNSKIPLLISAETIDADAREAFQLIDVTFENPTDRWVKINSARVVLGGVTNISLVTGTDLRDWAQAMSFKLRKDEQNESVAQGALIIGGAAAMAAGNQNNNAALSTVGAMAVVGTYGWAVSDVINSSVRNATQVNTLPDNHLSRSFAVPGKLFMRRWVLFNKPEGTLVQKLILEVETVNGEKDTYEVNL